MISALIEGCVSLRRVKLEDLERHKPNNLVLSERYPRSKRNRRKPRDPVERELLRWIVVQRVSEEERKGRIQYDGRKITIRLR